jgi:hypothetical protein
VALVGFTVFLSPLEREPPVYPVSALLPEDAACVARTLLNTNFHADVLSSATVCRRDRLGPPLQALAASLATVVIMGHSTALFRVAGMPFWTSRTC